jgi:hypothetical protein
MIEEPDQGCAANLTLKRVVPQMNQPRHAAKLRERWRRMADLVNMVLVMKQSGSGYHVQADNLGGKKQFMFVPRGC